MSANRRRLAEALLAFDCGAPRHVETLLAIVGAESQIRHAAKTSAKARARSSPQPGELFEKSVAKALPTSSSQAFGTRLEACCHRPAKKKTPLVR
jgi:hypothetical protein